MRAKQGLNQLYNNFLGWKIKLYKILRKNKNFKIALDNVGLSVIIEALLEELTATGVS